MPNCFPSGSISLTWGTLIWLLTRGFLILVLLKFCEFFYRVEMMGIEPMSKKIFLIQTTSLVCLNFWQLDLNKQKFNCYSLDVSNE